MAKDIKYGEAKQFHWGWNHEKTEMSLTERTELSVPYVPAVTEKMDKKMEATPALMRSTFKDIYKLLVHD
ncbi:hypothetical protein Tco_0790742 [Tanacetum coccineum]